MFEMFELFFKSCIDDPMFGVFVFISGILLCWSIRNFYLNIKEINNKESDDGSEEIQSDIHDDGN